MLEGLSFPRPGFAHRDCMGDRDLMVAPALVEPLPQRLRAMFESCEHEFPVDHWYVGGIAVWPLIRVDLYLRWVQAYSATGAAVAALPAAADADRLQRAGVIAARALTSVGAMLRRPLSPPAVKASVLLLSDGISFMNLAHQRFEKFCDPVASIYAEADIDCLKLDPAVRDGRSAAGWFGLGASLDIALQRSRLRRAAAPLLEGYEAFTEVARRSSGVGPMTRRDVARSAGIVEAYAAVFGRLLGSSGARLAFQVSYYSQVGFAFNLACRRAGIRVVDLQHGVAGDSNPAYGYWNCRPSRGLELLPTHFWCWSLAECDAIANWASGSGGEHSALRGCNLLPAFFEAGQIAQDPADTDELERLLAHGSAGTPRVLLTLQPNYMTDPVWRDRVNALIDRSAARLTWWVRPHPMMTDAADEIARALPRVARAALPAAARLPLHMLLANADVHATHSSATVREADELGVPSAVLSETGAGFFAASLAAGSAVRILLDGDISAAAEQVAALAGRPHSTAERTRAACSLIESARSVLLDLTGTGAAGRAADGDAATEENRDG